MTRSTGQASVEFVALLPLCAVALAALLQVCLLGHAVWAGAQAASAAARAAVVGGDVRQAALGSLPPHLERGLRVVRGEGEVTVSVRTPSLVLDLGAFTSTGRFAEPS